MGHKMSLLTKSEPIVQSSARGELGHHTPDKNDEGEAHDGPPDAVIVPLLLDQPATLEEQSGFDEPQTAPQQKRVGEEYSD